jgi:hypothetical protein
MAPEGLMSPFFYGPPLRSSSLNSDYLNLNMSSVFLLRLRLMQTDGELLSAAQE